MKSLADQLRAYSAYHHDPRNTLTHFLGVPLVIFGLFVVLGWLRFAYRHGYTYHRDAAAVFEATVSKRWSQVETTTQLDNLDELARLTDELKMFAESCLIFQLRIVAYCLIRVTLIGLRRCVAPNSQAS